SSFNVAIGPPAQLAFSAQPTATQAGSVIAGGTGGVKVQILDLGGNLTSSTGTVALAIDTNPPGDGTLSGLTAKAAVAGTATFTNLSIDKSGTGYTLGAFGSGLASATSNGFDITPGAPASLVFTQQPTATTAGAAISPAPAVQVDDGFGN